MTHNINKTGIIQTWGSGGVEDSRRPRILLAATGSVAAIKVPELARLLLAVGEVRLLATDPARHFFTDHEVPAAARPVHGCPSPRPLPHVAVSWQ